MSLLKLKDLLPIDRGILFFCIGTDRSTGDSLGPLVGTQLATKGYNVLGTLKNPVHAMNLQESINLANSIYPGHFIIAVDACLGRYERIGKISVSDKPIHPGAGVGKELQPVGDLSIVGIVNVSSGMEFLVLQSTRLSLVMNMAAEIVEAVVRAIPLEQDSFLKFLYKDLKRDYRPSLLSE